MGMSEAEKATTVQDNRPDDVEGGPSGALSPASLEILCRTLEHLGARHVFGVPGTQTTVLFEALRHSQLVPVVASNETAAAFMAGAYHRTSGSVGVVTTIPGPGLAYAIAGLAEAQLDSAAVLYVINGTSPTARIGYDAQAINQNLLLASVTKAVIRCHGPEDIEAAVRRAWELALTGEPGPVALELASLPDERAHSRTEMLLGGSSSPPDGVQSANAVEVIWKRIRSARKPVVVAGQGALAAGDAVTALAEQVRAPVLTTPSARGIVAESSPLAMGFDVLKGTTEAANGLIDAADLLIVLGAKLAHNGSAGFQLRLPAEKMVRVDTCRAALATTYPTPHSLVMDVTAFLRGRGPAALGRSEWSDDELAEWRREIGRPQAQDEPRIAGQKPAAFFGALRSCLPDDVRLVTDSGMHQIMARRHFDVRTPGGLLLPSDFQSMGFGVPAAIAARLADPTRDVVALVGDGGFRMSGFELSTAVRDGICLTVVVINDGALNQIRMQQLADYGAACGTRLGAIDFAAFAAAVGANYAHVKTLDDVAGAIGAGLSHGGVKLVEVQGTDSIAMRVGAIRQRGKRSAAQMLGKRLQTLRALVRGW